MSDKILTVTSVDVVASQISKRLLESSYTITTKTTLYKRLLTVIVFSDIGRLVN